MSRAIAILDSSRAVAVLDNRRTVTVLPHPDAVVVLDSPFTGADGTALGAYSPPIGGPWEIQAGAGVLQGNRLLVTVNALVAVVETGLTDVVATVVGRVSITDANHSVGIVLRAATFNDHWLLQARGDGVIRILERKDGNYLERRAGVWTPDVGLHTFVGVAIGSSMTLLVDGVESASYDSATHNAAATKHGLRANFMDLGDEFDSMRVVSA